MTLDKEAQTDDNWKATTQIKLILICLAIVSIVVALDATILVAALPTLATALNGTANETFWAGSAYLLTSAVFQPILVALSDVLGRREILFAALVLFTGGSTICCLANNFRVLLTGRAMQGIGGGGVIVMNLIIMTDVIPLRFRPKYNGVSQVAWALGTNIGPIIGGVIAEKTTWRWLFYLNFPFCAIGLLMVPFVVRISRTQKSVRAGLLGFDWLGSCLFIASSTALLIGLTWAGHQYPWDSYQTLVPLCLGAAGLLFTGLWEVSIAKQPFIRRTMLRDRSLMTAYFCTLLQGLTLYGGIYYLALLLLSVQARKPLNVGIVILPIGCGLVPASSLFGLAISRLGKWRWAVWAGWAFNTLAMGLLILLDTSTSVVAMVFIFLVLGLGQGALLVGHNFAVQALATVDDVASATALFAFMRGLGLCLGVAIGGAVFQNRLATFLSDAGLPTAIATTAESYITELVALPVASAQRIAVTQAYRKAFQSLFEVMTGISGLGFILSFTLRGASLDKILVSAHELQETEKN
ncbi:putative efflux pump antibiotic resistance protein [Rhexocercosporidium sp. MPI-PUGE-AT-0058]|nr:putative efflux pump antibiotic resistance protein [Rhexocercosporidium sp. MPI-PUGE-AT-0058]